MGKGGHSPTKEGRAAAKKGGQLSQWSQSKRPTRGSSSRQLEPEPEKGRAGRKPVSQQSQQTAELKKCPPNPVNDIDKTKEHKELGERLLKIADGIQNAIETLQQSADEGIEVARDAINTLKMMRGEMEEAKTWAGKANAKAVKSIKEMRKENMRAVQKEVLIKNVTKTGPVENVNKVKDAVLKHINAEAQRLKLGKLTSNQVTVSKLSWTKTDKDGNREDRYGAHKVSINAKVDYRKLMFSNLKKTTMRKDLGDKISIKNVIPKHLLARSKHLEKVAEKKRKEEGLQTKVALKEGGLFLYTRKKDDREWRQVKEEDLDLSVVTRSRQEDSESED